MLMLGHLWLVLSISHVHGTSVVCSCSGTEHQMAACIHGTSVCSHSNSEPHVAAGISGLFLFWSWAAGGLDLILKVTEQTI